jgi:hypothetical protein
MRRRLTLELALLRAVALGALLLLVVNPVRSRPGGARVPPLVLLDASLSMAGATGVWRAALDSARRLAVGGLIWRFGDAVTAFDTGAPAAGRSRLGPALAAAAGRRGPIIVVTDGAISDAADVPDDLRRRSRIVVLPRAAFFDAFVGSVDGPRRVAVGDTIRLRVAYGTAGTRDERGGTSGTRPSIAVSVAGRRLLTRRVPLPDSGVVVTEISLPSSLLPRPGLTALEVRVDGVSDAEPRDDARWFVVDVSPRPTAVVLASPPGWEARFFTQTLADVARVPVKLFVETEPGRWRDAATLAPVSVDAVRRAASGARLVALLGDPDRIAPFRRPGGVVWWPLTGAPSGDWYVDPVPASPLAGMLAGVAWDSLPPATVVSELWGEADVSVLLTARLARRGPARPLVVVRDSAGTRAVTVAGAGLWRWGFRGGASADAYRALVGAVADWLLAERGAGGRERFGPATLEAPNGVPLEWRWFGRSVPRPVRVTLESELASVTETLQFDAGGRADLLLPPGVYRWRAADGPEGGVVAVERYSDEWRPVPAVVAAQPGEPAGARRDVAARDRWWLYALVLTALVGEWVWRRRQGLP